MKHAIHIEADSISQLKQGLQAHLALFGTEDADAGTPKRSKKSKPEETVSDEEEKDFGTEELDEEDLAEDDEEESDDEEEATSGDDDAPTVDFKTLKAAVNKYGEKNADQMRAILAGFKIKSPKELSATKNEKHWDGVYRKVMAKLKKK